MTGGKKRVEVKLWTLVKADKEFSWMIRRRDKKCLFPGCKETDLKKLQCSHYHGRAHKGTRWNPDNCITLCWLHHFKDKLLGFEYQKQTKEVHGFDGQYTLFMRKLIGKKKMTELAKLARSTYPQTRAIIECMALVTGSATE